MATVTYDQTLTRQVEVEVTDEELAILRGGYSEAQDAIRQRIVDNALAIIAMQRIEPELAMVTCLDEDDEPLFEIG